MIKIHDKLWYVVSAKEDNTLAYMTHYKEDKAFASRKETGMSWAAPQKTRYCGETRKQVPIEWKAPVGVVVDNSPQIGFYIGESVCRWSTSNKLFRVTDPRGFTIEVPTGNIATLLHICDVHKGVIQEACVWGREGSNHILLSVNSEPYREGKTYMEILAPPIIKIKDIKKGSKVKLLNDSTVYTFLGRGKVTYTITLYHHTYCDPRSPARKVSLTNDIFEYTAKSYTNIFSMKYSENTYQETRSAPKIVEIVEEGDDEVYTGALDLYTPQGASEGIHYRVSSVVKSVVWK